MYSRMKRLVALFMVMVLTSSLLISCGKDKEKTSVESNATPEYVTRGEWITSLAESFGMTQFENQEPYYKDVTSDNPLFNYVQSSYEWDVLSTETDEFKPDEYATLGFAVTTAVLAAELDYEAHLTNDDVNEAIFKCANAAGITNVDYSDSDALTQPLDGVGAAAILASSVSSYMKMDNSEHLNITYQDHVIDTEKTPIKEITAMGTNASVKAEEAEQVEVGSVLLLPGNEEKPFGYCLKVVSKTLNSDGTYTIETVEPEIYEVFDSIDVDQSVAATPEMFIPAEGVNVINKEASNKVENLGYVTGVEKIDDLTNSNGEIDSLKVKEYDDKAYNSIELSLNYSSKDGFKGSLSAADDMVGKLTTSISKPNVDGLKNFGKVLDTLGPVSDDLCKKNDYSFVDDYIAGKMTDDELKEKFDKAKEDLGDKNYSGIEVGDTEKGWEVTGTLELKTEVEVCAKVDFKWGIIPKKLKEMSVTVSSTTDTNLEFKGYIKKPITLGKLNIPIAYGFGLTLKVELELEGSGSFKLSYQVENAVKMSYEDGDIKKTKSHEHKKEVSASIELEAGLKVSGTITFWGLGLAELGVKVSMALEVEGSISRSLEYNLVEIPDTGEKYFEYFDKIDFAAEVNFYAPMITFNVGGDDTLLGLIGIDFEWEVVDKEKLDPEPIWKYSSEDEDTSIILDYDKIPIREATTEETTEESTDESTTEESTTEEPTTEEPTTEEPTSEEESKGGTLSLSEFAVIMNVGDTKTLQATLPEGYSSSDLVWSVSEGTSVKVVNGTITAVGEGTSTITVKTADGKYQGQCVVVVN